MCRHLHMTHPCFTCNTKTHFKKKQHHSLPKKNLTFPPVTQVYAQGTRDVHSFLGFLKSSKFVISGRRKPRDMARYTQFIYSRRSPRTLPMRACYSSLCHHLSKCSYRRQSADGAAGLLAAVGQRIQFGSTE